MSSLAWLREPTVEPIKPIPQSVDLDQDRVALGKLLFHDKRLSEDNSVSCASCHNLAKAGTDLTRVSEGVSGQSGEVNSPTIFNSGYNFRQFWDGRAATLEDQIDGPVQNPKEMGTTWPKVIEKLSADKQYPKTFKAIYGDGITVNNIKNAIATFERSLITPNSRFDRYLRGRKTPSRLKKNGVINYSRTTVASPVTRAPMWVATCSRFLGFSTIILQSGATLPKRTSVVIT